VIGKKYFQFLFESKKLPKRLRLDRGTETGKMASIQFFLADKLNLFEDPVDSVVLVHQPLTKLSVCGETYTNG